MLKTVKAFASARGLELTDAQLTQLEKYVALVWQKKDFLNLTSSADTDEVFTRHICDGLAAAAEIQRLTAQHPAGSFTLADAGAGAGFIGLACAVALPQAQVTLIESIEKRCKFMQWVILQTGLKNARVKNARLGMGTDFQFDFITERAMGKLADILPLCVGALKPGGMFLAYQSGREEAPQAAAGQTVCVLEDCVPYTLPQEDKTRYLALFKKN